MTFNETAAYLEGLRAARRAVEPYANGEIILDSPTYVAADILREIDDLVDAHLAADPLAPEAPQDAPKA